MSRVSLNKTQGFTLIELMVSVALGIAAVSAIMFFYITNISSSYDTLKRSRLNHEINSMMSLMISDVRRAGAAPTLTGTINKYSLNGSTRLAIYPNSYDTPVYVPSVGSSTSDCITYSYDLEPFGTWSDSELFGFKLVDNEVVMRVGKATSENHCDDMDFGESLNDSSEIIVTRLEFDISNFKCINAAEPDSEEDGGSATIDDSVEFDCYKVTPDTGDFSVEIRQVKITIEAELTDDSDVTYSITQNVRVRNDHLSEN